MKFLGLIVLVAFMVSAFGLPLTQEQVEESAPVVSEFNDIQDLLAVRKQQAVTEVNDKISDWFKMVWGKIVKFFKELGVKIKADWLKVKAWFDKVGLKIKEFFQKLFPKELGEKILAALKKAWAAIVKKFNETVGKYKDLIIKALVADFKVIAGEAAKLLSQLVEGIAKIITDIIKHFIGPKYYAEELMEVDASIKEYWEMFKKIVVAMWKEKEAEFEAMWVKYKPILKALLEKLKVDFLHGAKTLAIDLLGDLIKIIIGWGENVVLGNEEELSNVDSKISDWFKKVWLKIKAFFDDLGVKIKKFFDDLGIKIKIDWLKVVKWFNDLGAKIKAAFDKVFPPELQAKILAALKKAWETIKAKAEEQFEKYKTAIIHALIEDGKTIVAEARMLLTEIINGVAKFITDIIKKIIGEKFMMDDEIADNGIVDLWEKIKAVIVKFFTEKGEKFRKMVKTFLPKVIEFLKKIRTDLWGKVKMMLIDLLGDLIKIILGWGDSGILNDEGVALTTSVGSISDWFQKVIAAIKKFFDDMGKTIKEFFLKMFSPEVRQKLIDAINHFGRRIMAFLNAIAEKYKDMIISALVKDGKFIMQEVEKLVSTFVKAAFDAIIDLVKKLVGGDLMMLMNDEVVSNDCIDHNPEYCIKNKFLCKEKGFVDFMKSMCPKTCGYCNEDMLDDEVVGNKIDDWFKEMWAKVKKFFIEWADGQIAEWDKFAAKYKPVWIEHWKQFKTDLIKDGREAVIDFLTDAVKIITDM